jgi:hypothetical protein
LLPNGLLRKEKEDPLAHAAGAYKAAAIRKTDSEGDGEMVGAAGWIGDGAFSCRAAV